MLRLFNIPARAPFLATLACALWEGRLVDGFPGGDPLRLSEAVVYLPTQRAARAFAAALVEASGRSGLALPRIVPLGAFSADEGDPAEFDDEPLDARPAVGELERRMTLARLIAGWGEALKGAIRRMGRDGIMEIDPGEPPLVASTPAQALALAGDLAALIDDLRIEGIGFERLGALVADAFDPYWRITLDFLEIAARHWPQWLAEKRLVDRAERAEAAVAREIARLGRRGPTIVAGSTGVNATTARLIEAVARTADGAVVLPGLDMALDDADFADLAQAVEPTTATHPQAALSRLMRRLGASRDDVGQLGAADARAAFLSQALRPAETTHLWRQAPRDAFALDGMALIEAETQAQESLAIALALRETLETPGRTAALVTPDPAIARRVAADLARWGIEVENSSGATLGTTPEGGFARLTLAAARDFSTAAVAALLACPGVRLGRENFRADARALDLGVLRAPLPATGLADSRAAFAAAREAAASAHAHRAVAGLDGQDFAAAEALLADLDAALRPLREADGGPLAGLIAAHRAALAALAAPDEIGEGVADLIDEWALAAGEGFNCGLADYAEMFETLAAGRAPPSPRGHPRLVLLGLLEARLLRFDRVVLAGLDETVWPPAARTDAFLNRQMRADLGLSPPERRIGQTAHDFVEALGTRDAILTRALKRDGAPTVASRLLRRIAAFAGDAAYEALRERGAFYLRIAAEVDAPTTSPPAERPAPAPPVELRPTRLSVTRIETLRRDPYAIYAERILKLHPLPPVGATLDAAGVGDVWHKALEVYARGGEWGRDRLAKVAEAAFAPLNADPGFRALRWPRIVEALEVFLAFDEQRRELAARIFIEADGRLDFALADGSTFTLTARADRIEIGRDGLATIIDYKTGAPPGVREVEVGFSPQMTLQAALLKRGGFSAVGAFETQSAIYLKLGGRDGGMEKPIRFKEASFAEVSEAHFAGLVALLDQYRRPATGYVSRPYPKFAAKGADYDHLARVAEWALAESDEP